MLRKMRRRMMMLWKMVEVHDVEDDEVQGEKDDDVENDDVEEADVEEEDRSQERDPDFCASLRSWNAHGRCRRATSRENLQENAGAQKRDPHLRSRNALWTFHKSHFVREFTGKMPGPRSTTQTLCEPAQSKCTLDISHSHFAREFTGKMPGPRSATQTLCEPARSNCTLNMSQEPFCTRIYRTNAGAQKRDACAVEMHLDISQEPFCARIYRKNAADQLEHPDQAPAFYSYRKNPSVWTHCLGNEKRWCSTSQSINKKQGVHLIKAH